MLPWNLIENNLTRTINIIFKDYDINNLSPYEKRAIIFEYLTNNLSYDYELLQEIKNFKTKQIKVSRDSIQELNNVIYHKKGICNAISQYYKLLLEKVGIKSHCIICDDGTEVAHQLNLVYNDETDTYSFDDITSVIVKKGSSYDYFDYDLKFASSINQGNKKVMGNQNYLILPESYINYLVKRDNSLTDTITAMPENIISTKDKAKHK